MVAVGRSAEVITVRLKPGVDVVEGLESVCREHRITAGSIEVLIGGVDGARLIVPVRDANSPSGVGPQEIEIDTPVAFTGGQGMVCTREDGQIEIHLHVTLADGERLYGGDLVKGSAKVTTTADAIISRIEGVVFSRKLDPQVNATVLHPYQQDA